MAVRRAESRATKLAGCDVALACKAAQVLNASQYVAQMAALESGESNRLTCLEIKANPSESTVRETAIDWARRRQRGKRERLLHHGLPVHLQPLLQCFVSLTLPTSNASDVVSHGNNADAVAKRCAGRCDRCSGACGRGWAVSKRAGHHAQKGTGRDLAVVR